MKQARVGLFVAAALVAMPALAFAQPKGAPPKAQPGKGDQPKEINLDEPQEAPKEGAAAPQGPEAGATPVAGEGGEGEGLGDICKIDPAACPTIDMEKAAARDMKPQMYAVQQIYALRNHRVEVNPYFGITMNDQFVGHNGPGLAVNYYLTNVLAIGVNGNFYHQLNTNSAFNFQTSRAARISMPLTEYSWNVNANLTYVPAYGKFAGFGDFIFHYDFLVLGGVGAISTRPYAIVDPDNRSFTFTPKVNFHLGVGLRIFFNRWFAATLQISDYIFVDELENTKIAGGFNKATGKLNAQDRATWTNPDQSIGDRLTNNVQAQVGLSIFLPFSWEYRLPK